MDQALLLGLFLIAGNCVDKFGDERCQTSYCHILFSLSLVSICCLGVENA